MSARNLALEYLKMAKQYGHRMAYGNTTLDDAITALEAELAQPAEPVEGWKLVPIEPTPEMWKAGLANLFRDVDAVWAAMLEKAPKP